MPTRPISFFSVDSLTCKLPRVLQREWSDPYLSPEDGSQGERGKPRCSSARGEGGEEGGDASGGG